MIHEYTFRIYYKDTDASGIAYHANYLSYAERARSEWFNEAGLPIDKLLPRGDSFVVCHADVTYKRPAPLNSLVKIKTVVKMKEVMQEVKLMKEDIFLTNMMIF